MAVYAVFRPNSLAPGTFEDVELFPSREEGQRLLKARARTQGSRTWYVRDGEERIWPRPEAEFPTANMTASMLVWLTPGSKTTGGAPGLEDLPTEVWRLTPGGAITRTPFNPDSRLPERAPLAATPTRKRSRVVLRSQQPALAAPKPVRAVADPRTTARPPAPRTTTPEPRRAPCPRCFQIPATTGACAC